MSNHQQMPGSPEERAAFEAQIRAQVEAAIAAEMTNGAKTPEEQQARVAQAQQELDVINSRLAAHKATINRYRAEIQAEQRSFERLPPAQRIKQLPQLEAAIKQKLALISGMEQEIMQLHSEQWQATQRFEAANMRLAMLQRG